MDTHSTDSTRQAALVAALSVPACYPHPVDAVEHLETHISHILLAGDYAYKIKKPLNLGFLDFTSLARRKTYCEEELRLNQRLAPDLYLDCIPIGGRVDNPELGGDPATALEYAVKMRRFSQSALLDRCLAQGVLTYRRMEALARQLAEFHAAVARADGKQLFGTPERVHHPVAENFSQIRPLLQDPQDLAVLEQIERWTTTKFERLRGVLADRKAGGFIRECHGDLHLGNMILQDGRITIFDCIEFNDNFRWIDVMSDVGFLLMDLTQRGAPGLAGRLLNCYLEHTGDYAGLAVLPYYQVYRAMVRAKIAAIRLAQIVEVDQREPLQAECRAYLQLALDFTCTPSPFLLITHGVSGSGKSHASGRLLEALGAIRIRSDVERKRLFGLGPLDASASAMNQGIYTAEVGARTYQRLLELAGPILDAGYPVLVDATFLRREQRQPFRDFAQRRGIPFVLLARVADPAILRERVARRQARGDNAAEADVKVLEQQLASYEPPGVDENPLVIGADALDGLVEAVQVRLRAFYEAAAND